MKTEYKRNLQNNYLVLEVAEPDAEDGYGLRMAEQNQVKGLLPVHESRRDGKLYLHYEITSKQTLESVYEKKVMGYQDILYVLSGIRDTLENMRKYLLSPQKLLFAPEMIYVLPERGGLLLCYYVKEDECPITMLAEFILKRLDHKDRQAVSLGYGFFQQASGANFSLVKALKEILAVSGEAGRQAAARASGNISGLPRGAQEEYARESSGVSRALQAEYSREGSGVSRASQAEYSGESPGASRASQAEYSKKRSGVPRASQIEYSSETAGIPRASQAEYSSETAGVPRASRMDHAKENYGNGAIYDNEGIDPVDTHREDADFWKWEDPPVIHRERRRKAERKESLADRVFSMVHPAILLSFLALLVILELLIVFGVLGLTEAGGCFFLILSAEMLINRKVLNKKKEAQEGWQEDEENEEYQEILREVYRNEAEAEAEPVEETRCLLQEEETDELCLKYMPGKNSEQNSEQVSWPDIYPGENPIYIGKIKGEADIILDSATVSRMHARLELRDGRCSLRDMNSKNGTFVNGRRLLPQEECEIRENDTVAFAEITYSVTKRRVYR